MTNGMQAIRGAFVALALAGCGSAAAKVTVTEVPAPYRAADVYLTAGDGYTEGTSGAVPATFDEGRICTPDFKVCLPAD